ncbi:MAG: pyrrolo-quinoline quinone [Alphaproteobacteria bacterium]|nr:pyrrolo-quinoline quinone [Alphaproteobacteria bacterium]
MQDGRIGRIALLLGAALTLTACDIFDKKKDPLPGERVRVFQDRRDLEPDRDVASLQIVLPQPAVNESWPQSGGFAHHAMHHLEIAPEPQIAWTAQIGSGGSDSRVLTTPPVVVDGRVFTKDAESTVSAFAADTGALLWRVTLKPEKARDGDEFGGGLAYYGGRLFVTTGFAHVFSLDPADGSEVWRSTVSAPVRGAPTVFADRVFAVSIDNRLHALAAVDGSELWQFAALQEAAGYLSGSSAAASGETLVAPFSSGELVALRVDNGRQSWNESLIGTRRELRAFGNLTDIRGRPVIDRGLVVAIGTAGQLAALDLRTGQRLWERGIAGNQTPWAAGRFVFIVTANSEIAAVHRADGKIKWVTPLTQFVNDDPRRPVLWAGPVLAGDRLLIGGSTGELLSVSPYTGEVVGKLDLREPLRLAPVIANRTVYVLTDSGRLIALR